MVVEPLMTQMYKKGQHAMALYQKGQQERAVQMRTKRLIMRRPYNGVEIGMLNPELSVSN